MISSACRRGMTDDEERMESRNGREGCDERRRLEDQADTSGQQESRRVSINNYLLTNSENSRRQTARDRERHAQTQRTAAGGAYTAF